MNPKFFALVIWMVLVSISAHAGREGNGGDMCEDRIKIIRDDINMWIAKGGSEELKLPNGITLEQYDTGMLAKISQAHISCTDEKVMVADAEKTCKNFVDQDGKAQILCNIHRFMQETSESDQYVLTNHEYAGLAGFEVNDGADSIYVISNQISSHLTDQVVKKLAVLAHNTTQGYDALAYSPSTGSHGTAVSFATPEAASSQALAWCGQDDCQIQYVVTAENNAALAISDDGGVWWGYDYGGLGMAMKHALEFCKESSDRCHIEAWTSLSGSY